MNRDELFRDIVKEHDRMIFRVCRYFLGAADNANDAHQEILLKIWLNLDKFRHESSIKTWIYRIAVNVCITFQSKIKKTEKVFVPVTKTITSIASEEDDNRQDDDLKIRFFKEFMEKLNTADKTLVTLYLEDLDTEEISSVTGLSSANVRVRIHRIKNSIRNEWEKKYGT